VTGAGESAGPAPVLSAARRWTIAWLLFASGLINYLDRSIVSVALPLIAADLHLGPATKGVLLSAFFWSYAFMQAPMGWLADRCDLRWVYAGFFAAWSLACGFTGFAGALGTLILLRILLGIGESIYVPGGMKIVSLLFERGERGLASGLMNCGTRAGLAVGAPVIAWLVVRFGWKNTFFIVGFSSLVWLAPWLLTFPARNRLPASPPVSKHGSSFSRLDRNLLALCSAHVCYAYYWYLLVTWLPDYLVESRHMPLQKAAGFAVVPYLTYTVSEPLGGWLADLLIRRGWRESRARKTMITAAFLTSLMLLPAGLVANDYTAVLLLGGAALVGLSTGNILALLQMSAPEAEVGLWSGIQNTAGNLSGIVAPLVTGLLIQRTGSHYPGFVVSVVVLLVGIPIYWWGVKDRKPAAP
jgi:MFS transporter, ACS family, D-galactonate transporter